MEIIEKFLSSFKDQDVGQDQNEAIIELLVWTMYVDKSLMIAEEEKKFLEDLKKVFSIK